MGFPQILQQRGQPGDTSSWPPEMCVGALMCRPGRQWRLLASGPEQSLPVAATVKIIQLREAHLTSIFGGLSKVQMWWL